MSSEILYPVIDGSRGWEPQTSTELSPRILADKREAEVYESAGS